MNLVDKAREICAESKDNFDKTKPRRSKWADRTFVVISKFLITAAAVFTIYGVAVLLSIHIIPNIFAGIPVLMGLNVKTATIQAVIALWLGPALLLILFTFALGLYLARIILNIANRSIKRIERKVYPERFADTCCHCRCSNRGKVSSCETTTTQRSRKNKKRK